jgi:hydrogenase-4 component F
MAVLLILIPLLMGALAFALPSNRWRPWLLPLGGSVQLVLVLVAIFAVEEVSGLYGWLLLDPPGKVVLGLLGALFFVIALYAPGYLALRAERPNRTLCANLFVSLAMMTLVTLSHHLGLMWVAMEATTLASAPSIYFNHTPRSLEATWKYLLLCSVGIALALLGSFFLAYASVHSGGPSTLMFDDLLAKAQARKLEPTWLHAAFVFLFVGYGTKMGLAPMHSWKPDTYGEAPGMVGALLAGGVTACAFLAIVRIYQIAHAAPDTTFARHIMVVMGLLSMAVAAVFMVRQRDFKRMLAYSSIEHMGILVLGVGLGGLAVYGAMLHVITNGLTKGLLFLSAGNIHRAYGSKNVADVHGALRRVPLSAALFLAGFFAITGSPPFGPFLSEFTIVSAAFATGQFVAGAILLSVLAVAFMGMGATVLAVVLGAPSKQAPDTGYRDSLLTGAPIVLCFALVLLLGLYVPPPLEAILQDAARFVEGPPGTR